MFVTLLVALPPSAALANCSHCAWPPGTTQIRVLLNLDSFERPRDDSHTKCVCAVGACPSFVPPGVSVPRMVPLDATGSVLPGVISALKNAIGILNEEGGSNLRLLYGGDTSLTFDNTPAGTVVIYGVCGSPGNLSARPPTGSLRLASAPPRPLKSNCSGLPTTAIGRSRPRMETRTFNGHSSMNSVTPSASSIPGASTSRMRTEWIQTRTSCATKAVAPRSR